MISTVESKEQQLRNGYFQSGSGPTQILINGSCRTLAYLSYLIRWNETGGQNQYTIRRTDPCDWVVSAVDIGGLEGDERILSVIKSCDTFIHEHLESYGMFNTSLECRKNVYQFGMNPTLDITIPNFHDRFVLYNDYADCGVVAPPDYIQKGEQALEQFCAICEKSSFHEFSDHFRQNWRTTRFFWRPNHVSAAFTTYIFRKMNQKFLNLPLDDNFWNAIAGEDLFKYPNTQVTDSDREGYQLKWN